jgi:hypothetical protein
VSDEPALLHLLTHLYGSAAGRFIASSAIAQPGETVVIILPDAPYETPTGLATEERGAYVAWEPPADPFPTIQFCTWQGRHASFAPSEIEAWDVVVGPLPGGMGFSSTSSDLLATLTRTARPHARAYLFVPTGALARRQPDVRDALASTGYISDLAFPVERPTVRKDGLGTSLSMAVVRWVADTSNTGDSTRVHALGAEHQRPFEVTLDPARPWSHGHLDPRLQQKISQWAQRGEAQPLSDLVEFPRPQVEASFGQILETWQITPRGIDLMVQAPERPRKQRQREQPPRVVVLAEDDIIGRTMREPHWARVDKATAELGLAVVPNHVLVLRPKRVDSRLLAQFLSSDAAELQLAPHRQGDQFNRVNRQALGELLVPSLQVSPALLRDPDPLLEFERLSTELVEDLRQRRRQAFDHPDAAHVSPALSDALGDAEMAGELLRRVVDPVQRAREFLPHPLARLLRVYNNHQRTDDPVAAYRTLLNFGETLTVLLGVVGLSYISHAQKPLPRDWLEGFRQGGVSFGHWLDATRSGAETARRDGEALGGLAQALSSAGPLMQALEAFNSERNNSAHGHRPQTRRDFLERTDVLDEQLQIAIQELGALSRSQWFAIERLELDQTSQLFTMTGRALKGEHPDFDTWIEKRQQPLATGVVYARIGDLNLPLNNFCRLESCPTCGHDELYYPDRRRGNTVRLLSLDRGHRLEMPVGADSFPV